MSSAAALLARCFLLARGLVVSPGSDIISRGAGNELENRGGDDAEPLRVLFMLVSEAGCVSWSLSGEEGNVGTNVSTFALECTRLSWR